MQENSGLKTKPQALTESGLWVLGLQLKFYGILWDVYLLDDETVSGMCGAAYMITSIETSASFPLSQALIFKWLSSSIQKLRVSATSAAALRIRRACTSPCEKGLRLWGLGV